MNLPVISSIPVNTNEIVFWGKTDAVALARNNFSIWPAWNDEWALWLPAKRAMYLIYIYRTVKLIRKTRGSGKAKRNSKLATLAAGRCYCWIYERCVRLLLRQWSCCSAKIICDAHRNSNGLTRQSWRRVVSGQYFARFVYRWFTPCIYYITDHFVWQWYNFF